MVIINSRVEKWIDGVREVMVTAMINYDMITSVVEVKAISPHGYLETVAEYEVLLIDIKGALEPIDFIKNHLWETYQIISQ